MENGALTYFRDCERFANVPVFQVMIIGVTGVTDYWSSFSRRYHVICARDFGAIAPFPRFNTP